jgi:Tol biopolymer transport system component
MDHSTNRCTVRRLLSGAVVAAVASPLVFGLVLTPAGAARSAITGITVDSARGATPSTAIGGSEPSVSGDGRLVVFVGEPLDDTDTRAGTVYLRDRAAGTLRELTVPGPGVRLGESRHPVLSGDGCSVAVVTELAFDLFRDDDAASRWDVYRVQLAECGGNDEWELVSTALSGDALNRVDPEVRPSVSSNGTVVAYASPADPWDPAEWPRQVSVADLTVPAGEPGRVRPVPGLPDARPTAGAEYRGQVDPAVSGSGRFVAFASDALADADPASWADPLDGVPPTQVYVWDRELDEVSLVSALPGATPTGVASQPSVSADGSRIAFTTTSTVLAAASYPACPETTCRVPQVVVAERDLDDTGAAQASAFRLVSGRTSDDAAPLEAGDAASTQPAITADGHAVAFVTRARNLLPTTTTFADDQSVGDLVLADLGTGALRRLAVLPDGASPAVGAHRAPSISETGRVVTFESVGAVQLAPGVPADAPAQVVSATLPTDLSMPTLDVGSVPVSWPSAEWFLALTNHGASSFRPTTITSSDPAFMVTGGTCGPGTVVVPGGSCTVHLVFIPVAEGPASTTITVAEEGFGAAAVSTLVVGAGGEPLLSADPAGTDLGVVDVGSASEPVTVRVSNVGFFDTVLSAVALSGLHPGDFQVVADGCTGAALPQGASCTVEVVFRPVDDGPRTALVTFTTVEGSRTSAIVAGQGRFRPVLLARPVVQVGQMLEAVGGGFGPGSRVVLSWADGTGRAVTVLTDIAGTFRAQLPLSSSERTGERLLVASDPSGEVDPAWAAVTVLPRSNPSPAVPLFPGRGG